MRDFLNSQTIKVDGAGATMRLETRKDSILYSKFFEFFKAWDNLLSDLYIRKKKD